MRIILIAILFFPLALFAQKPDTAKLLTAGKTSQAVETKGWVNPILNWQYKVGDNPAWATPGFDAADWQVASLNEIPYGSTDIPDGSIVWMRMRIKNDSSFVQPLVMRLHQTGASEMYLDGKLIHRFGVVSANPDSAVFYLPRAQNFAFPLINDSAQLLAVRFLHMPVKYPLYFNQVRSGFYPRLAQLKDAQDDHQSRLYDTHLKRLSIVLGAAFLLSVLFLSLYFFFRTQKVNLYFSLACLSLAANIGCRISLVNNHTFAELVTGYFSCAIFVLLYLMLFHFSFYKIFNLVLKWPYWIILSLTLLSVPGVIIINADILTLILAVLVVADALRITTNSIRKNRSVGARILQACLALNFVYWLLVLLDQFAVVDMASIYEYQPFAFLLNPIGLAIYIGYSFGNTSQSLRQKLDEVEQLSAEKQHILANQNELLEKQVTERTAALNQSLEELKSTQQQLIHAEKMASLGELTAGIAHEIQNPLNFVNNFSEVSTELVDEMKEELAIGNTQLAIEISNDLKQNLEKINHHGKRAGDIVKGMLAHSRTSSGQKELTDINALCDEYLRLSYHGLRAKDKNFNAAFETDFDNSIQKINVVPQDMGRVILNLINNAFYAVNERKKQNEPGYEPSVCVGTSTTVNGIELRIKDNGTGIPNEIAGKIFQPFFTTKPTGQGTGLGLSLSYDIVKAHGGELKVETKQAEGTMFIILLPA
ncbi:MAG TPA: ATP-binding protein [Ferruginibacter sp.]|nr:ATP-binding protein [Ferruginibacter sp.]